MASLKEEKKELGENLQRKTRELEIAQEKLTKLESVGILLEKEITPPSEGKTPKIVKAIEGKVVDIKPGGVVAINFKGSIKPQEGTTFYVIHSDQIKARLVLKEIYNTIMIAQMTTEGRTQNINYGDLVRLVLWAEE
ncbi:MAG TPA: hypothetical protein EYP78_07015 [Candidatus Omnitrophica bacterium]|nr:hypothetical protein [Candidatus Omnitrophota bacterium]